MKNFILATGFALLTVAFFSGYSNWGIPQIEPAPPPEEEALDLSAMTLEDFAALGGSIFEGKGTCTLCHTEVGGRAPMLDDVVALARERLADDAYDGEAGTVEEYLYESMVEPSAYVVPGFGKAGTGDTVSPMPNMLSGSIGLSEAEVVAVVAYLQDLGGHDITVEIPSDVTEEDLEEEDEGAQRAVFVTVEEVIDELACGACHMIAGEEGDLGPDLSAIGATRNRDFLRRAILSPNADIAEGFDAELMPEDYGELLYAAELEMLVDYLLDSK